MKQSLALAAALLLAAPGLGVAQIATPPVVPAEEQPAVTTELYVEKAAQTDLFEIAAAKLALERSQDPAIREFAQHMVHDHTDTAAKLKAALAEMRSSVSLPTELDAAHKAKLAALEQASGQAFDHLYAQAQVAGHTDALQLQQAYAESGDVETLRALAAATVTIVSSHLAMAKALKPG